MKDRLRLVASPALFVLMGEEEGVVGTSCVNVTKRNQGRLSLAVRHVISKMADGMEPPPFEEEQEQKEDDDLFSDAKEVCICNISCLFLFRLVVIARQHAYICRKPEFCPVSSYSHPE